MRGWRGLAAGRRARLATILLVAVQLGGCALELADPQPLVTPLLCLVDHPDYAALDIACVATVLVVGASCAAGLAALRFAAVRPFYWALLVLIPASIGAQAAIMHMNPDLHRIHHG